MALIERIVYLLIGGGIGFILGYIAAHLRAIETKVDAVKKEVHDVDEIIARKRDDRGLASFQNIALTFVVLVTAIAAFSTSYVNKRLNNTVECVVKYSTGQAEALKSRDRAIVEATNREIRLWGLYDTLVRRAKSHPSEIEKLQEELNTAIREYRYGLITTQKTRESYKYPAPDIIRDCKE